MINRYKEIYKILKNLIRKDFGKRCKDFDLGCVVCRVYLMLDILKDIVITIDLENKEKNYAQSIQKSIQKK